MINSMQGSLTMVNLHSTNPKIYWNGIEISGIVSVRVDSDEDEQRIKFRIVGDFPLEEQVLSEMVAEGIIIKKVQE